MDMSRAAANPNLDIKKVTWLELFFDIIFALALAMSARPLENVGDGITNTWSALAQFVLVYFFLIVFWYKHLALVNRFKRSTFLAEVITLFIGFLVIVFTQFIRIWRVNAALGSYLATIAIFLIALSTACLYFLSGLKISDGGENEKKWARASAKHMLFESLGYLTALIATPAIRPFWFIAVFIYFNRYAFMMWINPKAKPDLPPELQNIPIENIPHKAERMGLFSLLVYGLIVGLSAIPLMDIDISSADGILGPITLFGKMLIFIGIIWYIHYRLYNLAQPKGNQFTTMTFIILALLVATTQFIRIMFVNPSNFISIMFAVSAALLLGVLGTIYWNIPTMTGIAPSDPLKNAFRRWAYFLYSFSTVFFVSMFLTQVIRNLMWQGVLIIIFIGLLVDRGLNVNFYMGARAQKTRKYFDFQTSSGLSIIVIGIIIFFVTTVLLGKELASWWILLWVIPVAIGFFMILNHWLFKRIRAN
ncbi:low temperature requirement protein A [Candidatus Woesearchaeota archaeon]|nr:low temperature requirement protein A [Candidatus Woesearchaeota archaeon]